MIQKILPKLAKNINTNIISTILTCLVLAIIICLIYAFVPQELDINLIKTNFLIPITDFSPEQKERAAYIVSLLLIIPLFSAFYTYVFKKIEIKDNISLLNKITDVPTLISAILLIIIVPLMIIDYSKQIFLPCIIGAYFLYKYKDKKFWQSKFFARCAIFIAFIFIAKVIYLYLNEDIMDTYREYGHFSAFMYPILKVQNGLTINIDFNNIYGNYAYIYLLLSKVFGPWNMSKIIYFNLALLSACWILVGFSIYKLTKNKLLFLCIFLTFVYYMGGQGMFYLQNFPLRIVNFAFIWFLAGLILFAKEKQNKYLIPLGFIITCIGIIWNFESGLMSLISYTMFLIYRLALKESIKSKYFYKQSFYYLLQALLTSLTAILICFLIPYFRTGQIIPFAEFFWGINVFYKAGFFMLKINPYHPWFIPLIFYLIALVTTLNPILKFKKTRKAYLPFLFLTAIIGLGFYSYYQGRSHIDCLVSILFPLPIIIGILIERLKINLKIFARQNKLKPFYNALRIWNICLCLILFSFAIYACVVNFKIKFPSGKTDKSDTFTAVNVCLYKNNEDFIMGLSKEKDVLIIAQGASVFYQLLGIKDIYPFPPAEDLFLKRDYEKILDYIENHNNTILFSALYLERFKEYDLPRVNKILSEREMVDNTPLILFKYVGK